MISVRNEDAEWFAVGRGKECPTCIEKTWLTYYRKTNKVIAECRICKRIYDEKFTVMPFECSCGCGHLSFSAVIGDTCYNVMSTCKCKAGKNQPHVIRKKVIV